MAKHKQNQTISEKSFPAANATKAPSEAKLKSMSQAREQQRSAVAILEERIRLLKVLCGMLEMESKPRSIPESELATRFYGANTDTHRTRIKRHLTALHGEKDVGKANDELALKRLKPDKGRSYAWTADISKLRAKLKSMGIGNTTSTMMNRNRALALALARKYLRDVMPKHFMDELEKDFNGAEELMKEVIHKEGLLEDLNQLRKRVEMAQRGQQLAKARVDTETLDGIYSAITASRCISFDYQAGTPREKRHSKISVAGVLLRAPKLYLYGLPDGRDNKPDNYVQFQINLISNLEIHKRTTSRISHFDMQSHINDGFTDVLIDYRDRETYEIRIEVTPVGNLIRDLQDFPLSKKQTFKKSKSGKYLLSFPSRRTHQLLEYIVGRGNAFRVIAPSVLEEDIKKALQDTLAGYQ